MAGLDRPDTNRKTTCAYCGADPGVQEELLYECGECGTLYCDECGEGKGCPSCGAPITKAHPVEADGGASSWNPNNG